MSEMRRKSKALSIGLCERQNGSITVLVVAVLPVVLLLMGLSIDAGRVMAAKVELYKASDVAAREIAEEIDLREASETGRGTSSTTEEDAREWVEKNLDGMCGAEVLDVKVVNTEVYVEVESQASVPLLFSVLINRHSIIIRTASIGRLKVYPTGI